MNLRFTHAVLLLSAFAARAQTTLTNAGATITVTSGATLYVAGSVQNTASSTLSNAGTVQLTGDLTNAGTLASTGTLLFSGAQDQTFTPGSPSAVALANLTLTNTGAAGANRLFLAGDLTVSSLLTLTKGVVRTQGVGAGAPLYTLSLPSGGTVQGEGPGQYVQGRLQVARAAVNGGTAAVDFTNGLVLNPNGQDLGAVTVTRTAGLQAAGVSYGTNVGGTAKGIDRVWQVVASQQPSATAPASVTVSWVSDDDNGFNPATPAQLWRANQASGPWVAQGAAASASARSFTANTTQLGVLTVSNTSAPLPVTLVDFTAVAQGADALLRWATATETNNDHFEVEASTDATSFRRIGQVAGQGSSLKPHTYQLVDPGIAQYGASRVYYRLRQVDLDGSFHYSPVRTVAVQAVASLALFPNPTRSSATLTGAEPGATVQVLDALGRLVTTVTADAAGTAELQLSTALAKGVYVVRTGAKALRLSVTD
jgi:hypothetical protein